MSYAFFIFRGENMVVTFCGHSELPPSETSHIKRRLTQVVEELISKGANEFLLGGYGEFDKLCAAIVKELKGTYPHIKSILIIPYIDRTFDQQLYDCSEYPPLENVPKRFAISKRNEYMVDIADVLVCYITHTFGGAYKTLIYAKRKKKQIIDI